MTRGAQVARNACLAAAAVVIVPALSRAGGVPPPPWHERSLGRLDDLGIPDLSTLRASPERCSTAFVRCREGSCSIVVEERRVGRPFASIDPARITFSPDGRRLAYVGVKASGGPSVVVTVDGELRAADYGLELAGAETGGPDLEAVGEIVFSPDGAHLAYAAREEGAWSLMVDGRSEAPSLPGRPERLRFSDDGRHVIFVAHGEAGDEVWVDTRRVGRHDAVIAPPRLNRDGTRFLYGARDGERRFLVVDGVAGPTWDDVREGPFSRDGRHLAYLARKGDRWRVVVDGKPGAEVDAVAGFRLDPDPRHPVVVSLSNGTWRATVDGRTRATCPDEPGLSVYLESSGEEPALSLSTPDGQKRRVAVFSPDGRRLAMTEARGDGARLIVDGESGPSLADLDPGSIHFGEDSRHFAYRGRDVYDRHGWLAFVDWRGGPAVDEMPARPALRGGGICYPALYWNDITETSWVIEIYHSATRR